MREGMSDMARGKKGQILLLALLVMFVGAVILAGLFQYMGTSLLLATKGEENAVNYYAADSGIADALYGLMNNQSYEQKDYTLNYTNSGLNNRIVNISVVNDPGGLGDTTYLITSTATHNKSGASTKIESYVRAAPLEFYRFGDDAITSNCSVVLQPTGGQGDIVQGNVTYVCDVYCSDDPNKKRECPDDGDECCKQSVNGTVRQDTELPPGIDWWPDTSLLTKYFKDQVDISKSFNASVLDVPVASIIGPLYRDGDLEIMSSVGAEATLNGTIYVTGKLSIGGSGGADFTLNLNGQSIFVESNSEKPPKEALILGTKCTIEGSGAIFAIGDILFKPFLSTDSNDFVLIMSLEGGVDLQPGSDFYGSVVGNDDVYVSPNNALVHTDSELWWGNLPYPDVIVTKILTYDIVDR